MARKFVGPLKLKSRVAVQSPPLPIHCGSLFEVLHSTVDTTNRINSGKSIGRDAPIAPINDDGEGARKVRTLSSGPLVYGSESS